MIAGGFWGMGNRQRIEDTNLMAVIVIAVSILIKEKKKTHCIERKEGRKCACVCSFICVGERRVGRETECQEAVPERSSLGPEFLGRGLFSHLTPDSGSSPSSLPNFLHRSLSFQLLPDVSLLLNFPSFPASYSGISPYQVSPRFPNPVRKSFGR